MSDKNNNSKLPLIIMIIAVLAGFAYVQLSKNKTSETTEPTTTEQTATAEQATQPASAEEQKPVVVPTKVLPMPPGQEPTIPTAAPSNDPAVEAMMGTRKLGSDNAPIKVVEYSSLTCGHCASFHNTDFDKLKAEYIDTGKVQFIFKEFPLNKPAVDASMLARCMPQERYDSFTSLLFHEQEKWAYQQDYLNPLKQNAKLAGLSDEQIEKCLGNQELQSRIIGDMKAATDKFKIQSTPTFVVNDGAKMIVGHQPITFFEETFNSILGADAPVAQAAPAAPASAASAEGEKK